MFEKFKKNKEVMNILNKLNSNTSTGYIVGGAVRDILLGLEPNDIDFATNRNYEEVKELFSEFKCNETGKSFRVFHRSEADKTIRKMIHNIGKDNTRRLAELSFADDEGKFKENRHNELLLKVNSIIDTFNVPKVSDLKLNGYELKEMGYEGLEIGKVKKYLLSRILDEGIPNEREKLLEILHNDYKNNDNE